MTTRVVGVVTVHKGGKKARVYHEDITTPGGTWERTTEGEIVDLPGLSFDRYVTQTRRIVIEELPDEAGA